LVRKENGALRRRLTRSADLSMLADMTKNEKRGKSSKELRLVDLSRTPEAAVRALRLLAAALLFGGIAQAHAADTSPEIWLVSTRDAPHCGEPGAGLQGLRYWRLDDNCEWSPAGAEAFPTADNAMPTVVFIHGNRTDAAQAVTKGLYAYEVMRAQSAGQPFRYVIWSWPADKVCRGTHADTRLKADYSDIESYYLAQWLAQLRPGVKVSLVGHSFGPRIITGALHLLAGGQVGDQSMPPSTVAEWSGGKRNPVRAVLLASAVDADWLAPGGYHGLALSLTEQMLVTCDGCDRVLRWYPRMYGAGGPEALGFVGPCGVGNAENVEVLDVSGTVGKIHDWRCYCSAANVCARWAHYTFLEQPAAQP
jgi:hypothetical protein